MHGDLIGPSDHYPAQEQAEQAVQELLILRERLRLEGSPTARFFLTLHIGALWGHLADFRLHSHTYGHDPRIFDPLNYLP